MILPGHLPKLESLAGRALEAIQSIPEKDRQELQQAVSAFKEALDAQAVFNRTVKAALEGVDSAASETSDSWSRHFLTMGS